MSKDSRSGGKYTGNHTTLIPLGAQVCDIINNISHVHRISPDLIESGLKSVGGKRRVKLIVKRNKCILLKVRDNICIQQVWVYTKDVQATQTLLIDNLKKMNVEVEVVEEK
jgi:hypothetical protein